MSLIIDTVVTHLPPKRKATPSGWVSFNAVCCHHNGTNADRRSRGGLMVNEGVSYHCFNCGFKASWQPGRPLGVKFKKFLQWLGVQDDLITKCSLESLRLKEDTDKKYDQTLIPSFIDKALPIGSRPLKEWIQDPSEELIPVLEYLTSRGLDINDFDWHWTNEDGFQNRLIIPFYLNNRIVGYTARLTRDGKVKYISEQQPGYVFNLDRQTYDRKFVLVTEGPIDAICLDGVAVMSNDVSPRQAAQIARLQREVILVPDRDEAGLKMIEQAIELGWSVSMPEWPEGVKDVNDAVKLYGRIYTLLTVVNNKESMPLKIQLRMKKWIGTQ